MVIFAVEGIQGQGLPGDARIPTHNPDTRTPKFENCVSTTSYQFKFSKTALNTVGYLPLPYFHSIKLGSDKLRFNYIE